MLPVELIKYSDAYSGLEGTLHIPCGHREIEVSRKRATRIQIPQSPTIVELATHRATEVLVLAEDMHYHAELHGQGIAVMGQHEPDEVRVARGPRLNLIVNRRDECSGISLVDLFSSGHEFRALVSAPTRMVTIVVTDARVTVIAEWNGILDDAGPLRINVSNLDICSASLVAETAVAVTPKQ
jgi:hypothetical protein